MSPKRYMLLLGHGWKLQGHKHRLNDLFCGTQAQDVCPVTQEAYARNSRMTARAEGPRTEQWNLCAKTNLPFRLIIWVGDKNIPFLIDFLRFERFSFHEALDKSRHVMEQKHTQHKMSLLHRRTRLHSRSASGWNRKTTRSKSGRQKNKI